MKKLFFLTATAFLCFALTSSASHILGGEITWECQGNGQYLFQLKMYRDCNGIQLDPNQYLRADGGGVDTILLSVVSVSDLTPTGCGITCANPMGFLGATQEFIFRSQPITLTGTPPANGWTFYWDVECCRGNVDNIVNGAGGGSHMVLRSKMYSVDGLSADTCYDASPVFAERPLSFVCIGYPFAYNPVGYDADGDSLSYGFDYAYEFLGTGSGQAMAFLPPYSVNSPMPGSPAINSFSGAMNLYPQTGTLDGAHAVVVKAATYRCGQLIAEVFREFQVVLANNCPQVIGSAGNTINTPPQTSAAPFADSTGAFTLYADTINPGDTVHFTLNYFELQMSTGGVFQNFWINAWGEQLDSGSVAPYTDCATPPCGYINTPTPAGPYTASHQVIFDWITECAHGSYVEDCEPEYNTYYFILNATDNACPGSATDYKTVSVTVRKLTIMRNYDTLYTNTSFTNLQWYLNGVAIPGATGSMHIATTNGIYTLQGTVPAGCTVTSNREVMITVGVNELATDFQLQVIPNPAGNLTTISAKGLSNAVLMLYDLTGRAVLQQAFNEQATVDVNSLKKGMYVVEVSDKEGRSARGKVVRE